MNRLTLDGYPVTPRRGASLRGLQTQHTRSGASIPPRKAQLHAPALSRSGPGPRLFFLPVCESWKKFSLIRKLKLTETNTQEVSGAA